MIENCFRMLWLLRRDWKERRQYAKLEKEISNDADATSKTVRNK